jgi:hypothetical protein
MLNPEVSRSRRVKAARIVVSSGEKRSLTAVA